MSLQEECILGTAGGVLSIVTFVLSNLSWIVLIKVVNTIAFLDKNLSWTEIFLIFLRPNRKENKMDRSTWNLSYAEMIYL